MEEVVASVFDLMGKTVDPNLEDEFLKHRVDCMFHVSIDPITVSKFVRENKTICFGFRNWI